MITKTITLPENCFFHARPAGRFSTEASKYQSLVMIFFGSEFADGKRAFSLMRLSRLMGSPFELTTDGPDEAEAMEALTQLLNEIFD